MTTIDYWTTAAAPPSAATETKEKLRSVNWRLLLALGLNVVAWAAILKTL